MPWDGRISYLFHLINIFGREHLWRCVHVVEHRTVDAYRRVGTAIFREPLFQCRTHQTFLMSISSHLKILPCIAALHAAVGIVPMVEQTQRELRIIGHRRTQRMPADFLNANGGHKHHRAVRGRYGRKACRHADDSHRRRADLINDKREAFALPMVAQFARSDIDGSRTPRGSNLSSACKGIAQPQRNPSSVETERHISADNIKM